MICEIHQEMEDGNEIDTGHQPLVQSLQPKPGSEKNANMHVYAMPIHIHRTDTYNKIKT